MVYRSIVRLRFAVVFHVVLTAFFVGDPSSTVAQEFRIESQIYDESSKQPISQNITLFSKGLVYDFLMSSDARPTPVEIVIFNSRTRTLILLDMERKIRYELPDLKLLKIFDGVRRATLQDQRSKFLVEDTFSEDRDWSTGWVTLTAPSITYRFKGEQPNDLSVMPLYYEFLDHFTRLIAIDPQKIPPFPRVQLNQALKRMGWFPTEVQISVKQNSLFNQPYSAKSKHVMVAELSAQDRERIVDAKRRWIEFEMVDLSEYLKLNSSVSAKATEAAAVPGNEHTSRKN